MQVNGRSTSSSIGLRRRLHAMTCGRCFYCAMHVRLTDEPLPRDWLFLRGPALLVVEHGDPISRGGSDKAGNTVPSCRRCNGAKGSFKVDEFRFVKGLRAGTLNFSFPFEQPRVQRDWLCCHSRPFERDIFVRNFPNAAGAYSRGQLNRRPIRQFVKPAAAPEWGRQR